MPTTTSKVTIHAPAVRVWAALTKPELVKQWQYNTDLKTSWQKGSAILFHNEWEGKVYEQKGSILEIEPAKLVKYTLFAPQPGLEETPENSFVMTYTLEEHDGQTTLTITQEDPRAQQPETQGEENEPGVLNDLKKLVEGDTW